MRERGGGREGGGGDVRIEKMGEEGGKERGGGRGEGEGREREGGGVRKKFECSQSV